MIDLGLDQCNSFCGMFVPAKPGSARRSAQVNQCVRKNLMVDSYKDRCCPCSSIRMCPFKDEELKESPNGTNPASTTDDTADWVRSS